MSRISFATLVQNKKWDEVRQRMHSRPHVEIRSNADSFIDLISFEYTPFDIYVELIRICTNGQSILDPFSDGTILEHLDKFIAMVGPSNLVQKMFNRKSCTLDEAALEIMENQCSHLLFDWWTIRRCLELSYDLDRDDDRGLSERLFRIGIRQKIGTVVNDLQNGENRKTIIDSLSCYKDFYYDKFANLNFREDDSRMCFLEFFGVLQTDFQELLTCKDIVLGLKLMHSALDFGEYEVYENILLFLQSSPSDSIHASILHDLSLLKQPTAISRALGIGASQEHLHLYPNDYQVLFQTDDKNLSPLNYLWIMEPPPFNRTDTIFTRRWERDTALQVARVERTLKCLASYKKKFPVITRYFAQAWKGAMNMTHHNQHQDSLSLFTFKMMKCVIHKIAKDEDRQPLHVACDYGIPWNSGLKMLYREHGGCIDVVDPQSGLKPFALAAVGNESELCDVYKLLRLSPSAILH